MTNFKVVLGYDGSRYAGWQKQGNTDKTIQGKIESVLSRLEGEDVEVHGSGRTDAGVHALGQVMNVKLNHRMTCYELRAYLNEYLPTDIVVYEVTEVDSRFHARLNASKKTYRYRIWQEKVPPLFERNQVWEIWKKLDLDEMKEASKILLGTHDYLGFSALKKSKKSTIRTIHSIDIYPQGSEIVMDFTGDGFLMHEIRILVGTLAEIGAGERNQESLYEVFQTLDRKKAGATAPACGLCLLSVDYTR